MQGHGGRYGEGAEEAGGAVFLHWGGIGGWEGGREGGGREGEGDDFGGGVGGVEGEDDGIAGGFVWGGVMEVGRW